MIFFGLRPAVEDCPPILRVLDAEKASCSHTQITNTQFTASECTKIGHFFMKKRPTMAIFWSKVGIFGLSLFLRALVPKKQILGTHRSRKHNLQHSCAPKFAGFHEKKATNGPFLVTYLIFFGFVQAVEGSPPLF